MNISADFKGKIVLITGGTRGIGKGIAKSFIDSNAKVYICARNAPKEKIKNTTFLQCNVNDPENIGPDQEKIAKMVAIDCIFRIFIYEYCRELFSQEKKHTHIQKIDAGAKSIDKTIAFSFAELQKIDFAQIFERLLAFVPENMDNDTCKIIREFIFNIGTNSTFKR